MQTSVATMLVLAANAAAHGDPGSWPDSFKCEAGKNISSYVYDLHNQTWLVTGSDGRLGEPVTEYALRSGASVVATSRNQVTADANCAALRAKLGADTPVSCYAMDLSNLTQVREVVAAVDHVTALDVVLHVAATAGLNNLTADGFVETLQVNVISPVAINDALFQTDVRVHRPPRRILHVGSANCYDPLMWPTAVSKVDTTLKFLNGSEPQPDPSNPYYWCVLRFHQ
jgi:nucleoside-diphosphate-sugar epimerase